MDESEPLLGRGAIWASAISMAPRGSLVRLSGADRSASLADRDRPVVPEARPNGRVMNGQISACFVRRSDRGVTLAPGPAPGREKQCARESLLRVSTCARCVAISQATGPGRCPVCRSGAGAPGVLGSELLLSQCVRRSRRRTQLRVGARICKMTLVPTTRELQSRYCARAAPTSSPSAAGVLPRRNGDGTRGASPWRTATTIRSTAASSSWRRTGPTTSRGRWERIGTFRLYLCSSSSPGPSTPRGFAGTSRRPSAV